jgi:hypothetical protein
MQMQMHVQESLQIPLADAIGERQTGCSGWLAGVAAAPEGGPVAEWGP